MKPILMLPTSRILLACFLPLYVASLAACAGPPATLPDVPRAATMAPQSAPQPTWVFEPSWKERLPLRYVYRELRGDYREFGQSMRTLLREFESERILPEGPPFGLFFDDPACVPVDELRSRACVPVESLFETLPRGLLQEELPGGLVVYGRVRGLNPEASRAYGRLLEFAERLGWLAGGPVREVYLAEPSSSHGPLDWVTEIQIVRRDA